MKHITRTVWILSLVSLCTDLASEMLYPVWPGFLKSIGFTVAFIGILEGVAEAIAGLSKVYFGMYSDLLGKRVPFVRWGYALSAFSKPIMAFLSSPGWLLFARTTDRFGKGIRTGARDALLSAESNQDNRARVFGFHRSMDTVGAVLGPLVALGILAWKPGNYSFLFLVAFVPGLIATATTLFLHESRKEGVRNSNVPLRFSTAMRYWKHAPQQYRKLVAGLLAFSLFNSSDVFLLLAARESGFGDAITIGLYIGYNAVYALCAYPTGILADRVGLKKTLVWGMFLFALVYTGMTTAHKLTWFIPLFAAYGVYAAATEGISKAWITRVVPAGDIAWAVGTFAGYQSICALLASTVAGILWTYYGSGVALGISAVAAGGVGFYLLRYVPAPGKNEKREP